MEFELELPFPVSTNVYWRFIPGRKQPLISKAGRQFASAVAKLVLAHPNRGLLPLEGRLGIDILVTMPDFRRRDLDNFAGKSVLDALCKAGVYADDSQIDVLSARRLVASGERGARVLVWELEAG